MPALAKCVRVWRACFLLLSCVRSHDYVFERLMARTELFQGLAALKRQAALFVGKVVDALLASQERQVWCKRTGGGSWA